MVFFEQLQHMFKRCDCCKEKIGFFEDDVATYNRNSWPKILPKSIRFEGKETVKFHNHCRNKLYDPTYLTLKGIHG